LATALSRPCPETGKNGQPLKWRHRRRILYARLRMKKHTASGLMVRGMNAQMHMIKHITRGGNLQGKKKPEALFKAFPVFFIFLTSC